METLIHPEYVSRANSASHFDAGDSIEREARNVLAQFDTEFSTDSLTDEQKEYLAERRDQWRKFVINHYNDYCRRRADYMPVTVCGPARYPVQKMQKRVERMMTLFAEFAEKADRFLRNTRKNLENMIAPVRDAKAGHPAPDIQGWKFDGGEVVANYDANRLQILFNDKPGDEQRAALKKAAFKWSPRFKAWQRQLTQNALCATKRLLSASLFSK